MSAKHGDPVRGLMSAKKSPLFEGRFGRMFRTLPPATFGNTEDDNIKRLKKLGDAMSATFDPPKDSKDDEESGIPSLYTYLGQFIDHDITFDPASSLQKQNDPDALTDFRTPAFDLDNVYGRGPDDQPYLYNGNKKFLLGDRIGDGATLFANDLPRNNAARRRALIGDPRNDENSIVSQLQGLFLRFHNHAVDQFPLLSFEGLQQFVRFHYQYVILNDFLPRIVQASILDDLKENGRYAINKLRFFHWKNKPFLPVEFSAACYRLGHSMIRPGYRLNDNDATLLPIFPVLAKGLPNGLTGFQAMDPIRGIDWGRFIDIDIRQYDGTADQNKKRLQFAYRIDTSTVNPLTMLPDTVVSDPPPSLAQRNLIRGWRLGLPSGQQVAKAMGIQPLTDNKIILGKATDDPDPGAKKIAVVDPIFKGNAPLWTYILAEGALNKTIVKIPVVEDISISTPQLGPVGGRIVAEVFLGLMFGDRHSMLNLDPNFVPETGPDYKLKDFVQYALAG